MLSWNIPYLSGTLWGESTKAWNDVISCQILTSSWNATLWYHNCHAPWCNTVHGIWLIRRKACLAYSFKPDQYWQIWHISAAKQNNTNPAQTFAQIPLITWQWYYKIPITCLTCWVVSPASYTPISTRTSSLKSLTCVTRRTVTNTHTVASKCTSLAFYRYNWVAIIFIVDITYKIKCLL